MGLGIGFLVFVVCCFIGLGIGRTLFFPRDDKHHVILQAQHGIHSKVTQLTQKEDDSSQRIVVHLVNIIDHRTKYNKVIQEDFQEFLTETENTIVGGVVMKDGNCFYRAWILSLFGYIQKCIKRGIDCQVYKEKLKKVLTDDFPKNPEDVDWGSKSSSTTQGVQIQWTDLQCPSTFQRNNKESYLEYLNIFLEQQQPDIETLLMKYNQNQVFDFVMIYCVRQSIWKNIQRESQQQKQNHLKKKYQIDVNCIEQMGEEIVVKNQLPKDDRDFVFWILKSFEIPFLFFVSTQTKRHRTVKSQQGDQPRKIIIETRMREHQNQWLLPPSDQVGSTTSESISAPALMMLNSTEFFFGCQQ